MTTDEQDVSGRLDAGELLSEEPDNLSNEDLLVALSAVAQAHGKKKQRRERVLDRSDRRDSGVGAVLGHALRATRAALSRSAVRDHEERARAEEEEQFERLEEYLTTASDRLDPDLDEPNRGFR